MALNIGELVGYLKLDKKHFNAGLTAAREQMKRFGAGNDDLNQMQSRVAKIGQAFASTAMQAGNVQWVIFGIAGAMQLLGAASGVLGVGVGALASMAAAGITVKLGADGIKKAFEALNPTLDGLKAKVSSSFQSSLLPAVNNLKGVLPKLTGGFQQIATAIGGVATKVTIMMKSSEATRELQAILSNTAETTKNLGAAAAPLVRIFLDIASVGSAMLTDLTSGAGRVTQRFADWVSSARASGQLWAWMQKGVDTIKQLASYAGGIVMLFVHIFQALQQGAGATSMSIDSIVGSLIGLAAVVTGNPVLAFIGFLASTGIPILQQFIATAEGQAVFAALGDAMNRIGNVVSTVLVTAVQALAPLIPPLVAAFADLATQALPLVISAITFLAPVLLNIANFIQQNIGWIGPLAIGLGVWAAAQWALNAALDANPIGAVILAIGALIAIVATIITYWEPISGFFADLWNNIWKWTSDRISAIRDFIVNVWNGIVGFFTGLGSKISTAFSAVIDWFASLPGKIGTFLANLPGVLWDAFTTAFSFALNAVIQGIEWVIAEIIALPLQIIWVLSQLGQLLWQLLVDAWNLAVEAVTAGVTAVVDFVTQLPGRIIDGLIILGTLLVGWATDAWNWTLNTITAAVNNIVDFVRQLPSRIISGIAALGSMLSNAASSAWNWFINTMRDTASGIWSFVSSIPGRIWDALGDLGGLLIRAGKAIIDGLLNGLKSAVGAVWDFVSGIGDKIASLKGPLPYDRQLLVPAGLAIMGGLHAGLKEGFKPIQTWVSGVGETIAGTIAKNTGGMAAAAKEILGQYAGGGNVFEDFSFYGNSDNVRAYNDQITDMFSSSGRANTYDGIVAFLQDLANQQNRATVQIENYHPPADASPQEVATDLDWLSRTGG